MKLSQKSNKSYISLVDCNLLHKIAKYNFILRQEELEASNGEDKKGRSKYGAKKVNDIKSKVF